MKTIAIASFFMLSMLLNTGCEKDAPNLPASELILGQWKWISFGLKVVDSKGETLGILSEPFTPSAYVKFESPNVFYESEDGIDVDQSTWVLDPNNDKVTIANTVYDILRLDKEYLIIGVDLPDPATQNVSRYTLIFKR